MIAHNCIINEKAIWIAPFNTGRGTQEFILLECQKCGRQRRKIVEYEEEWPDSEDTEDIEWEEWTW